LSIKFQKYSDLNLFCKSSCCIITGIHFIDAQWKINQFTIVFLDESLTFANQSINFAVGLAISTSSIQI
jgi:hypothetical protein